MPKIFDEREKAWIRRKLLDTARDTIVRFGFKRLSVEELAKSAGIATGTFYGFFPSKEALFFELLEEEEARIRQDVTEAAEREDVMDGRAVERLLRRSFALMSESAVLRELLEPGMLESLMRKLPPEKLTANLIGDENALLPVVRRWQQAGLLPGVDPVLVVSLIRAIVLVSLHRREIGAERYEATLDLLIGVVAAGIVHFGKEGEADD